MNRHWPFQVTKLGPLTADPLGEAVQEVWDIANRELNGGWQVVTLNHSTFVMPPNGRRNPAFAGRLRNGDWYDFHDELLMVTVILVADGVLP